MAARIKEVGLRIDVVEAEQALPELLEHEVDVVHGWR